MLSRHTRRQCGIPWLGTLRSGRCGVPRWDFWGEVWAIFLVVVHLSLGLFGAPGDKSCCVSSCFLSFVFCDVQIFLRFNTWLYSAVLFLVFWWVKLKSSTFILVYISKKLQIIHRTCFCSLFLHISLSLCQFFPVFVQPEISQTTFFLYSQVIQHTLSAVAYCHSKGLSFRGVVRVHVESSHSIRMWMRLSFIYSMPMHQRRLCSRCCSLILRSCCFGCSWSAVDKIRHEFTFCIEGKPWKTKFGHAFHGSAY